MLREDNGTQQVVDDLQAEYALIVKAVNNLKKINSGEYKKGQDRIQFD